MKIINFIKKDILETRMSFIFKAFMFFIAFMGLSNIITGSNVLAGIWQIAYAGLLLIIFSRDSDVAFWNKATFDFVEIANEQQKVLNEISKAFKEVEEKREKKTK